MYNDDYTSTQLHKIHKKIKWILFKNKIKNFFNNIIEKIVEYIRNKLER